MHWEARYRSTPLSCNEPKIRFSFLCAHRYFNAVCFSRDAGCVRIQTKQSGTWIAQGARGRFGPNCPGIADAREVGPDFVFEIGHARPKRSQCQVLIGAIVVASLYRTLTAVHDSVPVVRCSVQLSAACLRKRKRSVTEMAIDVTS